MRSVRLEDHIVGNYAGFASGMMPFIRCVVRCCLLVVAPFSRYSSLDALPYISTVLALVFHDVNLLRRHC